MGLTAVDLDLLDHALGRLREGQRHLPEVPEAGRTVEEVAQMRSILEEVALRMQDNYPYGHPLYAGQMLKPPHAIAHLAYALAMEVNPNNHALDGGRASSAMEKECVAQLAAMFGWQRHLGHLTSGGTIANLEALWAHGRRAEGKVILASDQAHYTHSRISDVLRLPFEAIPTLADGRMDLAALEARVAKGDVGAVVATLGTTAQGAVDPLHEILALRGKYGFAVHCDAAYGGYFGLAEGLGADARAAFDAVAGADSIAIDPHKHGLQPYGCGCILFQDPSVGELYKHDSPYTYFTSDDLHLGEISLECSRAGAAAVALWATMQLFPLSSSGAFAGRLSSSLRAARVLAERIGADDRVALAFDPMLDIVVWAPRASTASAMSALSRRIFMETAEGDLHLAVATFPASMLKARFPGVQWDVERVACLRACLMKPEHEAWMDHIWQRLDAATRRVLARP